MQATMPASPTIERRPARMPRLSYRNSVTVEPSDLASYGPANPKSPTISEVPKSAGSEGTKTISSANTQADAASLLTPTTSRGNERSPSAAETAFSFPAQRKKGIFGGLFVTKEPTALALEKFKAQLEAQHGELSARAIPGVSSSRLPEHVPRVNTKWDGVPDAVKEREKLQKEKSATIKRYTTAQSTRPRSAEGSRQANSRRGDRQSLQQRDSTSTLSSFDSRGAAGHPRHSRFNSSDEGHSLSKTPSWSADGVEKSSKGYALRPASVSNLPSTTDFFPKDILIRPAPPPRYQSGRSTHSVGSTTTRSTDWTRHEPADVVVGSIPDLVPEYTSSPMGTPLDRSPITPSPFAQSHATDEPSTAPVINRVEEAVFVSSGADVLGPPATATMKRIKIASNEAFFAGEARPFELPDDDPSPALVESDLPFRRSANRKGRAPELSAPALARVQQDLEKRPDSSRSRLGLRASMLVRADHAPWDWQENEKRSILERSSSHGLNRTVVPKGLSKVLGKVNK